MQVRMRAVDIVAPRTYADALLRELHRIGIVHLARFEAPRGVGPAVFAPPGPDPATARAEGWLDAVDELAAVLGASRPDPAALVELWAAPVERLAAEVAAAAATRDEAAALTGERHRLAAEGDRFAAYRRVVDSLRTLVPHLPSLRGYGSTAVVVDARYRAVVPLIREELEALAKGRAEVVAADLPPDRVAAILIYPVRQAAEVRSLLGGRDIEEVTLPESLAGVPFEELMPRLEAETERIAAAIRHVDRALASLHDRHAARTVSLRLVLADRVAEARALHDAALSDHLVVLSGWVPADRVPELRDTLATTLGPQVVVAERTADPGPPPATVPVSLANGRLVRAFEPLASFVTLPRYGTIDPTPLIALTFPAFVGLMVGDAGYGLVLLLGLILARRRWRDSAAMTVLWPVGLMAAASTIAFGILFGEWFGDAGHRAFGIEPVWMDRAESLIPLLVVAVSIGAVQVGLGLVLGFVNAVLLRHRREAVGRAALFAALLATLVVVAAVAGVLPGEAAGVAVAAIVIACIVSGVAVGMAGPIEMIGVFGNVLSYARLMAIGLASVMLALVANRLGSLADDVLVGVLVAIVLHTLNIGLGFFDSTIQGLRLHYVEFFGRFVESGGIPYAPFHSVLGPGGATGTPVGRS